MLGIVLRAESSGLLLEEDSRSTLREDARRRVAPVLLEKVVLGRVLG